MAKLEIAVGSQFSADELADFTFLKDAIEMELARIGTPGETGYAFELDNNHMMSAIVYLEMIFKEYQAYDTKEDLQNYKKRLLLLTPQFAAVIDGFRSGIRRGITLNKDSINLLIKKFSDSCGGGNLSDVEATEFARKSPFNQKEKALELLGDEEFFVPVIRDVVVAGFSKVLKFVQDEYALHARAGAGIFGLPNWEQEYSNFVFLHTNTRYTADEIHELGLKEVARIEAEMEKAKVACGYQGTLQEFQKDINDKEKFPQLFYDELDKVIPDYEQICKTAIIKMQKYFNKFPKFECKVSPVPDYQEEQSPMAFYMPGTPSKSGTFYANMKLHKVKPSHTMTSLCLHEAIPGHHHQVSLALENDSLHLVRRLIYNTAYVEGWALYAEYLGEEMGFYGETRETATIDESFKYFGRLEEEQFRAVRLVIDSGLHGKGWTNEQAIEYFRSKVSAGLDEIESEVRRYCAIPGQALAYKIGEIKIRELRRFAEEALGSRFDIKEFHNSLIDFGSLPLGTLESVVKNWVKTVQAC
ncbi:hypothetical protein BC830DRAFT_1119735 [Chytriomyces sp. MP71]|nr:hypothetical protein BC830DRAFT_1119735 [Chytriomyces sp. MP71]